MNYVRWLIIAALIGGFLLVDIAIPGAIAGPHELWQPLAFGLAFAQLQLIALWATLTDGSVVWRLPTALFLCCMMWYALIVGNLIQGSISGNDRETAVTLGIVLLAGWLVAQTPLWLARRIFRWRLQLPQTQDGQGSEGQFHLRQVMIGSALLCVGLGLSNSVLPAGQVTGFDLPMELWIGLPIISLANLLVVLPCIWLAFAPNAPAFVASIVVLLIYSLLVTAGELAMLALFLPGIHGDLYARLVLFNLTQCVAVLATLGVLRSVGYRLERNGANSNTVPLEIPPSVNDNSPQSPPAIDPLRN
ncbi:MAG TPA: hypothetical protein VL096_18595 [Pirellulaceae bacterium]|nr:hypothetical protein [Pirellulaceae bacterium]